MAQSTAIQIGELARRAGCSVETIRYYERVGVLPRPPRSAGRYRLYDTGAVRRLAFVRRARELGFTLDEVRALLALSAANTENTCSEVREVTARHLADVRAKIANLRAMERVLSEAVRRCNAGEVPGCPLIDTLTASAPLHLVARRSVRKPRFAPATCCRLRTNSPPAISTTTQIATCEITSPLRKRRRPDASRAPPPSLSVVWRSNRVARSAGANPVKTPARTDTRNVKAKTRQSQLLSARSVYRPSPRCRGRRDTVRNITPLDWPWYTMNQTVFSMRQKRQERTHGTR